MPRKNAVAATTCNATVTACKNAARCAAIRPKLDSLNRCNGTCMPVRSICRSASQSAKLAPDALNSPRGICPSQPAMTRHDLWPVCALRSVICAKS